MGTAALAEDRVSAAAGRQDRVSAACLAEDLVGAAVGGEDRLAAAARADQTLRAGALAERRTSGEAGGVLVPGAVRRRRGRLTARVRDRLGASRAPMVHTSSVAFCSVPVGWTRNFPVPRALA
jgi:hypothetical protein